MKIYLHNNIVSGMSRGDLMSGSDPQRVEMDAVRQIVAAGERGELEIVTSRETWREQDRARDPAVRSQLEQGRHVPLVAPDHVLLITRAVYDNQGNFCGNSPMLTEITEPKLFAAFKSAGLQDADARHFMLRGRYGV